MLEVEQKFRIESFAPIEAAVVQLGATILPAISQVDRYFAHPSRNFVETDEAFRIRRVGEQIMVTYKGPKIDTETKTRREIELLLGEGQITLDSYTELFQALGFSVVTEVCKQRRRAQFVWQEQDVEIAFDEVEKVGDFVELEICVADTDFESAKASLLALAEHLNLTNVERGSYLGLLLSK